jgi:chorismate lyase/3-hydroxybenzoate synthase
VTARLPLTAPPLRVQRLSLAQGLALAASSPSLFGALGYGTPDGLAWMPTVNARVLTGGPPMADVWHASEHIESGTTGAVRWRCDGHWMLGAIDLDENVERSGVAALAERAYRDLFAALEATGCIHLLRIWNYLPQINGDGGGLERYRQFNAGRQQAFVDAGQAAFDGAPAACALGIHQGALSIRFLAGRTAPLAVENPRQVSAYRYPPAYGPRAPTFSRAALAEIGGGDVALFISGTASIVGHETVHVGQLLPQLEETLRNLAAVIAAANARTSAVFDLSALDCVVYVRHAADAPLVRQALEAALGPAAHTVSHAVYLEADICRQDLLVEIEAHAVARGALLP